MLVSSLLTRKSKASLISWQKPSAQSGSKCLSLTHQSQQLWLLFLASLNFSAPSDVSFTPRHYPRPLLNLLFFFFFSAWECSNLPVKFLSTNTPHFLFLCMCNFVPTPFCLFAPESSSVSRIQPLIVDGLADLSLIISQPNSQ